MPTKRARAKLSPRKKPSQERAQATFEAILQASAYILERRGWDAFTTNAVADRAGVNIASLYQYFPSKEAILVELMQRHVDAARAASLQALRASVGASAGRAPSIAAQARRQVDTLLAAHAVSPALHRIFTERGSLLGLAPLVTDVDDELAAENARWLATISARRPDAELALWMVHTAVHAVVHTAFLERPNDVQTEAFARELTHLVTQMLARAPTPKRSRR